MNPQKELWNLLSAINRGDRIQIDEGLSNLQEWNKTGGELPIVQARYVTGVENQVYIVTSKSNAPKV
jgi:hypothetical protein